MIICANIGLTVAGGFSMKKLWQLISTLQILVHYPLLNLPMQANVMMVLKGIKDISNLNIIPKDMIKPIINSIVRDQADELKDSFGEMGYESSNTLHNMGLAAILAVGILSIIVLIIILGKVCGKSTLQGFLLKINLELEFKQQF
ncbi:hypothetical protein FGO68_gene8186 [Halteria grandinella]|uniref:Uncharacterized protein n=1 Tax=Halteria grandinella TaxID=5974 RepID=A0A8J8TAK1_HALGN|nr:hypothetical protein FGO68_gene8186 [Halteria grandinella]